MAKEIYSDYTDQVEPLRERYGYFSIQREIMLTDRELFNLDPKRDHIIHSVGFFQK